MSVITHLSSYHSLDLIQPTIDSGKKLHYYMNTHYNIMAEKEEETFITQHRTHLAELHVIYKQTFILHQTTLS